MTGPKVCTAGLAEARQACVSGTWFIYDAEVYGAREEGRLSLFRNGVSSRTGFPSALAKSFRLPLQMAIGGYSKAGEAECMLLDDIPTMNIVPWLFEVPCSTADNAAVVHYEVCWSFEGPRQRLPQRDLEQEGPGISQSSGYLLRHQGPLISFPMVMYSESTSRSGTAHQNHKHGQSSGAKSSCASIDNHA